MTNVNLTEMLRDKSQAELAAAKLEGGGAMPGMAAAAPNSPVAIKLPNTYAVRSPFVL